MAGASYRQFLLVCVLVIWSVCAFAGESKVTSIGIVKLERRAQKGVPLTLSQVFKKGDIIGGIVVRVKGKEVPAQVDVKRRYEDDSIKHALVSLVLDELPAKGKVDVGFWDGKATSTGKSSVSISDLLNTDFDVAVSFTFPDDGIKTTGLRKMVGGAADSPRTWLRGPVVTEWLLEAPPTDKEGRPKLSTSATGRHSPCLVQAERTSSNVESSMAA